MKNTTSFEKISKIMRDMEVYLEFKGDDSDSSGGVNYYYASQLFRDMADQAGSYFGDYDYITMEDFDSFLMKFMRENSGDFHTYSDYIEELRDRVDDLFHQTA